MPISAKPVVICGPSGVGKSTLLNKLMADFKEYLGFSVSHTTRTPRPGEKDGVHYYFVKKEDMMESIKTGNFIEHAQFAGNFYGTSKQAVKDVMNQNKICIFDIEIEGVKQVKNSSIDPYYIFIKPPSIESLEKRLMSRGTENKESVSRRLSVAKEIIEYGETEGNFDLIITNDDIDMAYKILRKFMLKNIENLKQN